MEQQKPGVLKAPQRAVKWRYNTAVQAARVLNSTARARRVGEGLAKRAVVRSVSPGS